LHKPAVAKLAALVLAALAAVELGRAALGLRLGPLPRIPSLALQIALASFWAAGALSLARRARAGAPPTRAPLAGRVAWITLALEGTLETLARAGEGSARLVAAMIVAIAVEGVLASNERKPGDEKRSSPVDALLGRRA
jgi:hypothetical protein